MNYINSLINGNRWFTDKISKLFTFLLLFSAFLTLTANAQQVSKINRKAIVTRHNLTITHRNLKGPTQVGNGHFAFGFDITGLQTFSHEAITMSDWGWHTFPQPNGQTAADCAVAICDGG